MPPPPLPYHLLVQQLFALIFERGGEVAEADFLAGRFALIRRGKKALGAVENR